MWKHNKHMFAIKYYENPKKCFSNTKSSGNCLLRAFSKDHYSFHVSKLAELVNKSQMNSRKCLKNCSLWNFLRSSIMLTYLFKAFVSHTCFQALIQFYGFLRDSKKSTRAFTDSCRYFEAFLNVTYIFGTLSQNKSL